MRVSIKIYAVSQSCVLYTARTPTKQYITTNRGGLGTRLRRPCYCIFATLAKMNKAKIIWLEFCMGMPNSWGCRILYDTVLQRFPLALF